MIGVEDGFRRWTFLPGLWEGPFACFRGDLGAWDWREWCRSFFAGVGGREVGLHTWEMDFWRLLVKGEGICGEDAVDNKNASLLFI